MRGKLHRQVGIDIGATAVRVVEVSGLGADSAARVTKAAIEPLQPGAVAAGQIQDTNAVGWAVARALKTANASGYGAVLGVSSGDTAVARVQLSSVLKPSEWEKVLRTTDRQISVKVPLETAAVSLYPVPDPTDATNPLQRTLLAAATMEAEVDRVLAVARKAKVTPRAVDLSAAAMVRALTRSVRGTADVGTFVDIGFSRVTVATREGLHLRSVRTFDGGGERITRSIMGAAGLSYDAAEEAKLSMRLSSTTRSANSPGLALPSLTPVYGSLSTVTPSGVRPASDPAHDALSTAVNSLVEEIAAAIEADAAANPGRPTQGVVLCGGTSLLRGLKDHLVQRVGVPAIIGRPWARIEPSRTTESVLIGQSPADPHGVEDPVVLLSLAPAVGLAIWEDPR